MKLALLACGLLISTTAAPLASAQTESEPPPPSLELRDFRPRSMLRVDATEVERARFPIVDVHTHFRIRKWDSPDKFAEYLDVMNRRNIAMCVSLDGQLGPELIAHRDFLEMHAPGRFLVFANLDFQGAGEADSPETWAVNQPGFVNDCVEGLVEAKRLGAAGLKLFKEFGLGYRHADGTLIEIDDPRFDPIWEICGELDLPVLLHTADPAAFFEPIDATNERWEELSRRPQWSFHGEQFPTREVLLAARNRVIGRHPNTRFIGAHVANNAEDLATVADWLDTYPNLYVEFASRIGELGRQPYTARRFIEQYHDRVLFGTDGPWPEERLALYLRFLETDDEYFPYSEKPFPPQGFWMIYGVHLDEPTLRDIYYRNAARLFPQVRPHLYELTQDPRLKP
ncbi:MAG: amidohydrolase family protein [Pirellulaceae bacterium]